MRCIIQQVSKASVYIQKLQTTRSIGPGLLIYQAIHKQDIHHQEQIKHFIKKIQTVKILSDQEGKISQSMQEQDREILLISNFTLYGKNKKGRSIDYTQSAPYADAKKVYQHTIQELQNQQISYKTGVFGEKMMVTSTVEGPVNYIRETQTTL